MAYCLSAKQEGCYLALPVPVFFGKVGMVQVASGTSHYESMDQGGRE